MPTQSQTTKVQSCPDCGKPTSKVKLGPEPARLICGRFGCSFDGRTVEGGE